MQKPDRLKIQESSQCLFHFISLLCIAFCERLSERMEKLGELRDVFYTHTHLSLSLARSYVCNINCESVFVYALYNSSTDIE